MRSAASVAIAVCLSLAPLAVAAKPAKARHAAKKKAVRPPPPEAPVAPPKPDEPKLLAKAEADKATLAFKLGRFDEALAGYTRAYEIFQASGLLFNIGQCHRQMKHHEKAIFFLSGYLRDNPDAANAEDVGRFIEEEKKALAQEEQAASRPVVASSAPVVVRDAPIAQPPIAALRAAPPGPVHKQWWFWTAIGGGAVAVGVAVTLAVIFTRPAAGPATTLGSLDRSQ
jgi:tetratricopeptide (TPR) repeat protein